MTKYGLVGFFDVLGYQSIIDNNEIEDVIKIITNIIKKIPEQIKKILVHFFKKSDIDYDLFINSIKINIISDSILLSYSLNEMSISYRPTCVIFFTAYVSILTSQMFYNGLPIRGAIGCGDYYLDENSFAGKCIIDCYRISETLNLSGVVISDEVYLKLFNIFNLIKEGEDIIEIVGDMNSEVYDEMIQKTNILKDFYMKFSTKYFFKYLVPTKTGEEKLYILNWPYNEKKYIDIRQKVFESFSAHKKDISISVQNKLLNTEFVIRTMIIHENSIINNKANG